MNFSKHDKSRWLLMRCGKRCGWGQIFDEIGRVVPIFIWSCQLTFFFRKIIFLVIQFIHKVRFSPIWPFAFRYTMHIAHPQIPQRCQYFFIQSKKRLDLVIPKKKKRNILRNPVVFFLKHMLDGLRWTNFPNFQSSRTLRLPSLRSISSRNESTLIMNHIQMKIQT